MRRPILLTALPLLTGMVGCVSMAPKYVVPEAPVSKTWPEGPSYQGGGASQAASDLPWQDFYGDAKLRSVLELALANNRDLRIAALNTEKMRAYYQIQRSAVLPNIDAVGSAYRERVPADLSSSGATQINHKYSATVGITSWELDFFGRIQSLKKQAVEQFFATEEAQRSVRISLLSGVANVYLALAADRENLQLAQETLVSQAASHQLIQRRYEVGVASELDTSRAQISLETARGDVAKFTRTVAVDENTLNLLVGSKVPADLLPQSLGQMTALRDVSQGLPSEVLTRRPDILAAEHQLQAANANIGAARAAFFPRIALTTTFGTASGDLSKLFESAQKSWTFAPSLVLPIFDVGLRSANLKVAKADRAIYVARYEQAIQTAFKEVADTLAAKGTLDEQLNAQAALVKALERTHFLAESRYKVGVDGYLSVLDAQRSLYAAQQGLIALRYAKAANQVTLFKVLGGGKAGA